jgi:hypothetical protein
MRTVLEELHSLEATFGLISTNLLKLSSSLLWNHHEDPRVHEECPLPDA